MGISKHEIILDVLICTLGETGIQRIVAANHPSVHGVRYIVSWQLPDKDMTIPEELHNREDFVIVKNKTRGLSKNRNLAIEAASAPICLISDDDLQYNAKALSDIITIFKQNKNMDIATFKYEGADHKIYSNETFNLTKPPKGFYITSFEIAFRLDTIKETGIKFNENFGIGAKFPAGEEDIWISDLLKKGLNGRFFPINIASHMGQTTGTRRAHEPEFIKIKGAVFTHTHPRIWPLHMLAHAWRNHKSGSGISTFTYLKSWLNGAFSK